MSSRPRKRERNSAIFASEGEWRWTVTCFSAADLDQLAESARFAGGDPLRLVEQRIRDFDLGRLHRSPIYHVGSPTMPRSRALCFITQGSPRARAMPGWDFGCQLLALNTGQIRVSFYKCIFFDAIPVDKG